MQIKQQLAFLKSLLAGKDPGSSLRSRAMHSGVWIGAGFAVQKVLQLGSNLILTRLLFPEAFGLMALANVFLIGMAMFSDIGLKPAVIRDPRGDDPQFLNTAWTIQAARGLMLCVIGALIAYPLSLIYRQPVLFPLFAVLSIIPAVSGFTSIGSAMAERRLDFRTTTLVQIAGQSASIGLLVTIAYFWRSVWALAVANVISTVATVTIGHLLLSGPKGGHRLVMNRDHASSLVHFGRWIMFSTIATYLGGEGLKAVQGGLLTPAEFGVLAIAYTIAGIPNELAMKLSNVLGLSVLAETNRNTPQNVWGALHALRLRTLGVAFFLFSGVILLAQPLIRFLYDSRYHEAGYFLISLSLANAIASIGQGYTSTILALGKGSTYFYLTSAMATLRILGLISGFEEGGITGMLYGVAVANIAATALIWAIAQKSSLLDIRLDLNFLSATSLVFIISLYL